MNRHMTFMFKQCWWHQCSNNTNRWMTSMSSPYKLMKNTFCMTIIAKSWPMKFVMKWYSNVMWDERKLVMNEGSPSQVDLTTKVEPNEPKKTRKENWNWIREKKMAYELN